MGPSYVRVMYASLVQKFRASCQGRLPNEQRRWHLLGQAQSDTIPMRLIQLTLKGVVKKNQFDDDAVEDNA